MQPFFSGIVLDVTPQIDEDDNIILHIHPSVSEVTESTTGGQPRRRAGRPIRLPLAKSTVNETDTIVRVQDGNIVAIGGLMSVDVRDNRGGLPGITEGGLGDLARNTDKRSTEERAGDPAQADRDPVRPQLGAGPRRDAQAHGDRTGSR